MQKREYIVLVLALLSLSSLNAIAQDTTNGAVSNQIILKATGPYEDISHYAVARKEDKVVKYLADADAAAADVVKILPPAEAREFERLRLKLHEAIAAKDTTTAAENGVTIFRMLVDRLDASTLVVPKEVELMDYAGYKLAVLAAAGKPDWEALRKLADENEAWWKAIAPKVTDKHLRASVTSAVAGTKQATAQENLAMVQFGSQMILDLVDMLENDFKKAKAAQTGK